MSSLRQNNWGWDMGKRVTNATAGAIAAIEAAATGLKNSMPAEFPRDVATVVTLTPKGDVTEVTVTEHTTTSKQMMEYSKMGLEQVMDQMGKSFDGAAN